MGNCSPRIRGLLRPRTDGVLRDRPHRLRPGPPAGPGRRSGHGRRGLRLRQRTADGRALHGRGTHERETGRYGDPLPDIRRRPLHSGRPRRGRRVDRRTPLLPARPRRRRTTPVAVHRPGRPGHSRSRRPDPRLVHGQLRRSLSDDLHRRRRPPPRTTLRVGFQPGHRAGHDRRPTSGSGGQPTTVGGRNPRHRRLTEGRALRGILRRLQPSVGDPRRHLRLLPGEGPGVARHDPLRSADGLRLRPGHRSPGMRDPAKILWWRLHRHGLALHGQRPDAGLALRGDRGHGSPWGSRDLASGRRGRRTSRPGGVLRGTAPEPLHRRRARIGRPGNRTGRDQG